MSDEGSPHEKDGNTVWVSCPACAAWFHVTDALVDRGDVALRCPQCQASFLPGEAREIIRG